MPAITTSSIHFIFMYYLNRALDLPNIFKPQSSILDETGLQSVETEECFKKENTGNGRGLFKYGDQRKAALLSALLPALICPIYCSGAQHTLCYKCNTIVGTFVLFYYS